jgi:hypothetical protein
MRIGTIGWLTAIGLALVYAAPTQAVAPPVYAVTMERGGPLNPLDMLPGREWCPRAERKAAEFCLPCPPEFSPPTVRPFPIVVRIEDRTTLPDYFPGPVSHCLSVGQLSSHCFHRTIREPDPPLDPLHQAGGTHALFVNDWVPGPTQMDREAKANAIMDCLQQKLMELHEKEWSEVEFTPKVGDCTEMHIRYQPVCPAPPSSRDGSGGEPFNFWPLFYE